MGSASQLKRLNVLSKHAIQIFFYNFSREIEIGQNNVHKSDNFSREIEVGQIDVIKSDNFSREIEIGQNSVNKSDNFSREVKLKSWVLTVVLTLPQARPLTRRCFLLSC